jgi:hypothetical protein
MTSMRTDRKRRSTWTALLPDGRRARLRIAVGVRLCVGDQIRIGRRLFTVVGREILSDVHRWLVRVEPASADVARPALAV